MKKQTPMMMSASTRTGGVGSKLPLPKCVFFRTRNVSKLLKIKGTALQSIIPLIYDILGYILVVKLAVKNKPKGRRCYLFRTKMPNFGQKWQL